MVDPESVDFLIKYLQSLGFEPRHVTSKIAWRAPYRNVDGSRHYGELLAADSWERLRELLLVAWQKEATIYCQHTIHALNKQVLYRMMAMRRSKAQVLDALEKRGESVADLVDILHWLSMCCNPSAKEYYNSFKCATTWTELRRLLNVKTCVNAASSIYGQDTAFILLDEMWFLLFRKECERDDVRQLTNLIERMPTKRARDDDDDEDLPAYAEDDEPEKKKKKSRFSFIC